MNKQHYNQLLFQQTMTLPHLSPVCSGSIHRASTSASNIINLYKDKCNNSTKILLFDKTKLLQSHWDKIECRTVPLFPLEKKTHFFSNCSMIIEPNFFEAKCVSPNRKMQANFKRKREWAKFTHILPPAVLRHMTWQVFVVGECVKEICPV